jgi:hypothetical protein
MIITLGCQSGVGKDTFVTFCIDYLRTIPGLKISIKREGFADKLYEICYKLYHWAGFMPRQYYITNPEAKNKKLPKLDQTPRELLIGIGEAIRVFDKEAFIRSVLVDDADVKFIPDIRNTEEWNKAVEIGATKVRIVRQITTNFKMDDRLLDKEWDVTIYNTDFNTFRLAAIKFCNEVILPWVTKTKDTNMAHFTTMAKPPVQ